jgi:OPA family glycerol-3-phosphate transporter-like MFS transporter 1/2
MRPLPLSACTHACELFVYSLACEFQLWGINGFAQGIVFPALMLLLSGYLDKRTRGTVLGLWTTSQQLGGVVATAFVGFVLQHAGWRAAYVGTAVHVSCFRFVDLRTPAPFL